MADDANKYSGPNHQGDARSAPYPVSRLGAATDLVDIARQIGSADASVATHTHARLRVIADQMQALQDEARRILEDARRDQELHRAECAFKRIPGKVYHLYRRSDGRTLWSMLSPREWGTRPPHEFVGSYRLEADQSWTALDQVNQGADVDAMLRRLIDVSEQDQAPR